MIWLLTIPFIFFFTFKNIIGDNWLLINGGMDNAGFLGWTFTIVVGCFISGIISLAPIFIAYWIGEIPKVWGVVDEEYPLVSLKEKSGIKGQFFLGSGSIEGVEYYFWYRRNKDGSVEGGKSNVSGAKIYEQDATPTMVEYKTDYKNKYVKYYIWFIGLDKRSKEADGEWCPTFTIPKNSIQIGYNL